MPRENSTAIMRIALEYLRLYYYVAREILLTPGAVTFARAAQLRTSV